MATISFWARGDSSSANNSYINSETKTKIPTTQLTFTSGTSGDIKLDYNGGLPDPDTQVIIGSNTYSFTLEFTGTLPYSTKLTNVAGTNVQGEQIAVVTVHDGTATGTRYYFFVDGSGSFQIMNAMPNGSLSIGNYSTGGGPVLICFAEGTMILTPSGETAVEDLLPGDLVLNHMGEVRELRWVARRHLSAVDLAMHPEWQPIRIPAHAFGPGLPYQDLWLSPRHRVLLSGWQMELNFGLENALVAAANLVGDIVHRDPKSEITYYHLLFDDHEVVVSNGLETESFQPGQRGIAGLDPLAREELLGIFPELASHAADGRPDAYPTIGGNQTALLRPRLAPALARAA